MPTLRLKRARAEGLHPALAVVGVIGIDLLLSVRRWPLPVTGLLDEAAHLLTAWLALAALASRRTRIWPWALLGAVTIDVDHAPLYWWNGLASLPGGRPVTHSLVTLGALLAVAAAIPRLRVPLTGLSVGVLLHFVRDVATGPGVAFAWPVTTTHLLLPYWFYFTALAALAAVVTVRRRNSAPASREERLALPLRGWS